MSPLVAPASRGEASRLFSRIHANLRRLLAVVIALLGVGAVEASEGLERAFCSPPDAAKPWAYWWWLNANVTRASITRDLEEMKQKGLGGFLLFDVTAYGQHLVPSPPRKIEFMSPPWRALVRHAMHEAHRLGLEMSINLSTCGGALRAPWKTGPQAPKILVWSSVDVEGPRRVNLAAPRLRGPEAWDAALVAARISDPVGGDAALPAANAQEIRFSNDPSSWREAGAGASSPRANAAGKTKPITALEVVDLTDKMDAEGRLAWDTPEGRWRVFRFLFTVAKDAEYDVDMLDAAAVESFFDRMGGAILEDAGPLVGKTLTHFYSVSWEGAIPTWTVDFDRQFERYRGYSPRPYLPVLAGVTVANPEVSQRFVRDFGRTLADCFMDNCYSKLGALCHRVGLKWHSESGGPWRRDTLLFAHADALEFWGRNDMPQGEFWWPGKPEIGRSNGLQAAMAAHIYGRPLASIEAFTHMVPHWSAYPAALKPGADSAFCDGINRFIWHTFSASPIEFGKPGIVYFAGTHLNPNVTWWEHAGALLAYLARCQAMLQQGRFVADVCCYRSDQNYVMWDRTPKTPRPALGLPNGYAMDLINTEVLVKRLAVQGDRLVLPDGMSYRVLWLDPADEPLPPEALKKVLQLAADGATVVLGPRRPRRAPGLKNYPACDDELRWLTGELWGASDGRPSRRPVGKGRVVAGVPIQQALHDAKILPDCDGPWEYHHRHADGVDWYFVAGSGSGECVFRVQGKEPEIWDPKTGAMRDAVWYRTTDDGRTVVPLTLPEHGSVFVVFRRPVSAPRLTAIAGPAAGLEIEGRTSAGVNVRFWQQGRFVFRTSAGQDVAFEAGRTEPALPLEGPWTVRFAPGWDAPESIVFDRLVAWDKHSHPAIKHFSGTATYQIAFHCGASQARGLARLQLGDVKHVARVRVNGKDLGVIWTSPWVADLSGALKEGENRLEIDVTNLWVNRLIGDAALPEDQRRTKTNIYLQRGDRTVKPYQGYGSNDPLVPSGLLGPVRVEFGQRREIPLGTMQSPGTG